MNVFSFIKLKGLVVKTNYSMRLVRPGAPYEEEWWTKLENRLRSIALEELGKLEEETDTFVSGFVSGVFLKGETFELDISHRNIELRIGSSLIMPVVWFESLVPRTIASSIRRIEEKRGKLEEIEHRNWEKELRKRRIGNAF